MFQSLVAVYALLILALIACMRNILAKDHTRNRTNMIRLIGTAIFMVSSYTLSMLIPSIYPRMAAFATGLYFIGMDWLALMLMLFVADYTQIRLPWRSPRNLLYLWIVADTLSFLVNTFTGHLFTLQRVSLSWGAYWHIQTAPLHGMHMALMVLVLIHCSVMLIHRLIVSPWIYKSKFGAVLTLLGVIILLNAVRSRFETAFDYSVLACGLLAASVCYFVLYVSPRNLLESMHSKLVEDSSVGLFVYDEDKHCVGVNRAARELFTLEGEDIFRYAEQYLASWEKEYGWRLKDSLSADRQMIKNGEKLYIRVDYQKFLDDKGRTLGASFQFEDQTDIVRQVYEDKYKATHDPLTGLFNRDAFEARVKEILAEPDGEYYMLYSNIKDFKLINELCGSEVGDALLKAQANTIRTDESGNSVSCRMYADKFCTLLPKGDFNEEGFTRNMSAVMDSVLSVPLKTHFYFGIYEVTDRTEPIWTMCDKAMMAVESINGSYEQVVSFYKDEMFDRIIREKGIIGRFDTAIENGEFHMFLQPQIKSSDGSLVGAEALVRWIDPEKGVISPASFIPVLEKSGLIHKLDLYMWDKAAQQLEKWKKQGRENLFISVNISTKDFYLIDVTAAFRDLLGRYDFNVKNLKLEITESALMKDVKKVMKTMDELHALGYEIEIDDFGSGYSSLGMLKDIHADILKIDMIFLQETVNVTRSSTILKNMISMSKELGMPVITEGVETREHVDFLSGVGCDMFQGYYFAKPMKVENFESAYCS